MCIISRLFSLHVGFSALPEEDNVAFLVFLESPMTVLTWSAPHAQTSKPESDDKQHSHMGYVAKLDKESLKASLSGVYAVCAAMMIFFFFH